MKVLFCQLRSGSGKVVQEFYEELSEIWKGSPATEMLSFGIKSLDQQGNVGNERPITPSSSIVTDSSLCESDNKDSTCEDRDNDVDEKLGGFCCLFDFVCSYLLPTVCLY